MLDRLRETMQTAYHITEFGGGLRPTNCNNCGAPLNWNLAKCEHCETQFQEPLQLFYNPAFVKAQDLEKPLIPVRPSLWSGLIENGLAAAVVVLPTILPRKF